MNEDNKIIDKMSTSDKWLHLLNQYRRKTYIERTVDYYNDLLNQCMVHCELLYERRIVHRYTVNSTVEQIIKTRAECDKLIFSIDKKIKRPLTGLFNNIMRNVEQIIFAVGMNNFTDLLSYLSIPYNVSDETHYRWLNNSTPCILSKERGPCEHMFFRPLVVMNQNSLSENQGIWVSLPYRKRSHIAVKVILNRDPLGLINDAFRGKIRILEQSCQDILWIVPSKYIITESANELRHRINQMKQHRERIGKTPIGKVIKEFLNADLSRQVTLFSSMCLPGSKQEFLDPIISTLYDLIANHSIVNRRDVIDVIDILPWKVQQRIREIRNHVLSRDAIQEDEIPDDSRLQLLPIDDNTKRAALHKLREAKVRNGEGSSKASAWVQGFFRIPFGIYRREPILQHRERTINEIENILEYENGTDLFHCSEELYSVMSNNYPHLLSFYENKKLFWNRDIAFDSLRSINDISLLREIANEIGITNISPKASKRTIIQSIINKVDIIDIVDFYTSVTAHAGIFPEECQQVVEVLDKWQSHCSYLSQTLHNTQMLLDDCIYHQNQAKEQITRIIGQWMVGDDTGYCLGFEGPPGVGKTTLAREGLSKILTDEDGNQRPFHMIALGTATTGSTLVGHNYTYQGSQWGDIVRILMDSECMNPIIYVDELDKVSQTENGREIVSILTHLTDPAQNEEFQDRYFAGIKLNMSRVLFVFSYNDPSLIDPILLDRIHRIKFNPLTTSEKLKIVSDYTLPEIQKTLGMADDSMVIDESILRYIITRFTNEAGVRKLREILYDTFREVNLCHINSGNNFKPVILDLEFVKNRILYTRNDTYATKADLVDNHTRVYGMFATSSGIGGILPIRVDVDPTAKDPETFPITITGQLGDVMKESINIARIVALRHLKKVPKMGLHVHFPEGATPKDGPSAGVAITLAIWAFVTKTPIPGNLAITGEMDLDGNILPIGGIQSKLTGSADAGITRVLVPPDNEHDVDVVKMRIPDSELPETILYPKNFNEVLDMFRHSTPTSTEISTENNREISKHTDTSQSKSVDEVIKEELTDLSLQTLRDEIRRIKQNIEKYVPKEE